MKSDRLWIILLIVGLVLIVWGLTRGGSETADVSPSPSVSGSNIVDVPGSLNGGSGASPTPSGDPSKPTDQWTYVDYLAAYEGKRIQFDINCQAIPNRFVVKNGTKLMFDNRSGDARTIVVGGQARQFQGYGYWILTMRGVNQTLNIDCGAARNVGQIIIEP